MLPTTQALQNKKTFSEDKINEIWTQQQPDLLGFSAFESEKWK